MAWTTLSFPFGSILTSAKMTQLYDNFAALANKDSGAPQLASSYVTNAMLAGSIASSKLTDYPWGSEDLRADSVNASEISAGAVGQSEIGNGAVHRAELDTGTASTNGTNDTDITLNAYSFFPMIHTVGNNILDGHNSDGNSADAPRFRIRTSSSWDVDHRYVNS